MLKHIHLKHLTFECTNTKDNTKKDKVISLISIVVLEKVNEEKKEKQVPEYCYLQAGWGRKYGVSSDLDGCRGVLKREVFFHTFLCVLVRICNQTSSNQHLLVVGC